MFIYNILKAVSSIAVTLCTLIGGYCIWKVIKGFFQGQKLSISDCIAPIRDLVGNLAGGITKPLLIVSLIATIITSTAIHQLVGIHNLQLKPEGTYCFYVEATRYGGNTYVLPAQIRVEKDTEEVSEGRNKTFTYYYIEKVFFSNGGWIDTEESEPIDINESSYYYDYDADDEWELVLLNEHAYSPYVPETNNADWLDVTFLLIKVISIGFSLFALCYKEKPKDAKHPACEEDINHQG